MSPYFHAVFHNRHQLHITEKATQLALDKKKKPTPTHKNNKGLQ